MEGHVKDRTTPTQAVASTAAPHGPNGPGSHLGHNPVLHHRLYQRTACSLPLLLLRLPPVKRWAARQHKAGRDKVVYLVFPAARGGVHHLLRLYRQ